MNSFSLVTGISMLTSIICHSPKYFQSSIEYVVQEPLFFTRCESVTIHVVLCHGDSLLFEQEYGEQWKGKIREIGKWFFWDDSISINETMYEIDTLVGLRYLIPPNAKDLWKQRKDLIYNRIINDKRYIPNLKNTLQLRKIEYFAAQRYICGTGIYYEDKITFRTDKSWLRKIKSL